jgi:hypothetical protein
MILILIIIRAPIDLFNPISLSEKPGRATINAKLSAVLARCVAFCNLVDPRFPTTLPPPNILIALRRGRAFRPSGKAS